MPALAPIVCAEGHRRVPSHRSLLAPTPPRWLTTSGAAAWPANEPANTCDEVQKAVKSSRKRQFAWLSKSTFVSNRRASWRPQKRYRVSSAVVAIDHQLQVAAARLSMFTPQSGDPAPWGSAPILHMALHRESSNLTTGHWLYTRGTHTHIKVR